MSTDTPHDEQAVRKACSDWFHEHHETLVVEANRSLYTSAFYFVFEAWKAALASAPSEKKECFEDRLARDAAEDSVASSKTLPTREQAATAISEIIATDPGQRSATRRNHEYHKREDDLRHCKVCGGAEGSLPTDCPGSKMPESVEAAVFAGALDFNGGSWRIK